MPSPLYHCTSLAELQALVARAERAYPHLDWRARAAGGLIAADVVEPDARHRRFRVAGPFGERHAVDLEDGSCSCPDRHAPLARATKLCAHLLACLILKHLDQRLRHQRAFLPPDEPDDDWDELCLTERGRRSARAAERPFWDAAQPDGDHTACGHPPSVMAADGARCLWCDDGPIDPRDDDPRCTHP
jgi:hypothetical protein